MDLKYAHLCDYAGAGALAKPILIGIFDRVFALAARPIGLPPFYLFAVIEAHVTEGTDHVAEIRLTDENGNDVMDRVKVDIHFGSHGEGLPLATNLVVYCPGLRLQDVGDYVFYVLIDGNDVASIPMSVVPAPQLG